MTPLGNRSCHSCTDLRGVVCVDWGQRDILARRPSVRRADQAGRLANSGSSARIPSMCAASGLPLTSGTRNSPADRDCPRMYFASARLRLGFTVTRVNSGQGSAVLEDHPLRQVVAHTATCSPGSKCCRSQRAQRSASASNSAYVHCRRSGVGNPRPAPAIRHLGGDVTYLLRLLRPLSSGGPLPSESSVKWSSALMCPFAATPPQAIHS